MGRKKKKKYFTMYEEDDLHDLEDEFDQGHAAPQSVYHPYTYTQRQYDYTAPAGGYNYDFQKFSTWNWGYANTYDPSVPEDKLHYKTPIGYKTPTRHDIEKELRKRGHISTFHNENMVCNMARFFYFKLVGEQGLKQPYESLSASDPKTFVEKYPVQAGLHAFLLKCPMKGNGPLEKAINAFEELAKASKKDDKSVLKVDVISENGINIRQDVYMDADYRELMDRMEHNQDKKVGILQKLSLIQDFGTEFKVEKEITERLAPNSRITSRRRLHDYSQLHMVEAYQRLLPNYQMKLLHKDLIIKAHVEKKILKQKMIMIVDYSGSMNNKEKQEWVLALLMDRLRYVLKGEGELFFSYFTFVTSSLEFIHIHDRQSVFDFWKTYRTSPNACGTDVGRIVHYIGEEVEKGRLHNLDVNLSSDKPELLVVNDGQDQIKTTAFTYKTNAVTLMQDNVELKELCKANRGRYVHISKDDKVHYE
jgi:Mg-chelatase subunit ChlD